MNRIITGLVTTGLLIFSTVASGCGQGEEITATIPAIPDKIQLSDMPPIFVGREAPTTKPVDEPDMGISSPTSIKIVWPDGRDQLIDTEGYGSFCVESEFIDYITGKTEFHKMRFYNIRYSKPLGIVSYEAIIDGQHYSYP